MSSGSAETRVALLEAAWSRLEKEGPTGLKLGAVARDAGVSRQAVYLHFGSRAGLLLELVEYIDVKLELGKHFREIPKTDDPVEHVRNLLRVMVRYAPKIQDVGLAMEFSRHDDPDIAAAFDDRMAQRIGEMTRAVRDIEEAGRLREGWRVEDVVTAVWAMGRPSFFEAVVTERGWTVEQYERFVITSFDATFVVD